MGPEEARLRLPLAPGLEPNPNPNPHPAPAPDPNPKPDSDPDPDPNPDPEPNPSPTQVSNDTQNRQFYSDIRKSAAPAARFEVMGSLSKPEPGPEPYA